MPQPVRPFEHQDPERKSDETLRQEARMRLGSTPPLQLVAELLNKLRALDLPWWTPELLRSRWTATERMRWYRARPDLRQHITSALTGLAPKASRKKAPDFQASLIDSVLDEGDVSVRVFEEAFDPSDLVVYGPVDAFWGAFIERMPWGQDTPIHQELGAWLIDALLTDHSSIEGLSRRPILSPWETRTSIDGRVWHTRMPLEIRVAIDEARFQKERDQPAEPFHVATDLSIAVSATITANIPLRDLTPVFSTAERAMGFPASPRSGPHPEPGRSPPEAAAPHRSSANPPAPVRVDAAPKAEAPAEARPAARQNSPSSPPAPIIERTSGAQAPPPSKGGPPPLPSAPALSGGPPPLPAAPPPMPAMPPPLPPGPLQPPSGALSQTLLGVQSPPMPSGPPPLGQRPATLSTPLPAPRRSSNEYPAHPGGPPPGARRSDYPPPPQGGAPPSFQGGSGGGPPGGGSAGPTSTPLDRPAASSRFEAPPVERPAASSRFELPPQSKSEPPRAATKSDSPPSAGKLSSLGLLLDELADMPSEEDRTNPWDVTGDEAPDEVTGMTIPGRREHVVEAGKRRRFGKP